MPEDLQPEMRDSLIQFTECDESELLQVEEIHRHMVADSASLASCQNDSSISAAPHTIPMADGQEFDIQAAYHQITTGSCCIRLKRCNVDDYSPPLKKSKSCESHENAAPAVASEIDQNESVTPLFPSSPYDSDDEARATYECSPSGSNGIKLVRTKEVSRTALFDKLQNLHRNIVPSAPVPSAPVPSSSLEDGSRNDESDEPAKKITKKQTSRKSTYRPSVEVDQRRKETLERVKSKTDRKRHQSSPEKIRKKSLKYQIAAEFKSKQRYRYTTSKLCAEESSLSDEDRFDIKPRYEVSAAPVKVSSPPKITFRQPSKPVASVSTPTVSDELQDATKAKPIRTCSGGDMPSIDALEDDSVVAKTEVKSESKESDSVLLPVTIKPSARPPIVESKVEGVNSTIKNVSKLVDFPKLGKSITISLVPPVEKKSIPSADRKLIPPADKKSAPPADKKLIPPADKKLATPADKRSASPADKKSAPSADKSVASQDPAVKSDTISSGSSSVNIKDEPTDPTQDDEPVKPTSKIGSIKLRAPQALGITDQLKSFAEGMAYLCHLPANSISPTLLPTSATSNVATSVVAEPSAGTNIPRDPRLTNVASNAEPSLPAAQSPTLRSPLPQATSTSLASNSPRSTVIQSPISQTGSSPQASEQQPTARSSAADKAVQDLKNKMAAELLTISAHLSVILKEHFTGRQSQKKRAEIEKNHYATFRMAVKSLMGMVSRYAGANKELFLKHVQYYIVKLLRNVEPKRSLHPEEVKVLLNLMIHKTLTTHFYDESVLYGCLSQRAKEISKESSQRARTSNPELQNVQTSPSTSLSPSQPESAVHERRIDQPPYQGSVAKHQQNLPQGTQFPVNPQRMPMQPIMSNQHNCYPKNNQSCNSAEQQRLQNQPPASHIQRPSAPHIRVAANSLSPSQRPSTSHIPVTNQPLPASMSAGNVHRDYAPSRMVVNTFQHSQQPVQAPQQPVVDPMRMQHISQQISPQYPVTSQQILNMSPSASSNPVSHLLPTGMPVGNSPLASIPYSSQNRSILQVQTRTIINTTMQGLNNPIYPVSANTTTQQPSYQPGQQQQYSPMYTEQQLREYQRQVWQCQQQPQQVHQQQQQFQQQQQIHYQQLPPGQLIQPPVQPPVQTQQYPSTNLPTQWPHPSLHALHQLTDYSFMPSATAPVSVPLVNSSQSPSPGYNPVDSMVAALPSDQPVSVNVVQSTSRTSPEQTPVAVERNFSACKEIDKAEYEMYNNCTKLLKEFYKATMAAFENQGKS